MKYFLLTLFCFVSFEFTSFQVTDTTKSIPLQENEKITQIEDDISRQDASLSELNQRLEDRLRETKNDIYILLSIIGTVILIVAGLFGWIINVFGWKAIKTRIEEIIADSSEKIAEDKLNKILKSKLTDQLIEETIRKKVDKDVTVKISEINTKAEKAIKDFESRGREILNSIAIPSQIDDNSPPSEEEKQAKFYFDLAFKSSNHKQKVKFYNKVLEILPDHFASYHNIALSYFEYDDFKNAKINIERALEISPKEVKALVLLSQIYVGLSKYDEAISKVDEAILIDPSFALLYSVKGEALGGKNMIDEASKMFEKAIGIDDTNPSIIFKRGYFYYTVKKYEESIDDYLHAEKLSFPKLSLLYNNIAVSYRLLGDLENALLFVNKSLEYVHIQENPNTYGTLALIHSDRGNDSEFYQYITIALDKGCKAWLYLDDKGFDRFRNTEKFKTLIEAYKS